MMKTRHTLKIWDFVPQRTFYHIPDWFRTLCICKLLVLSTACLSVSLLHWATFLLSQVGPAQKRDDQSAVDSSELLYRTSAKLWILSQVDWLQKSWHR